MLLDDRRCYDALRSRDRRFDGRFWVGVRTTGVYCRPVCPSRTPKAANVSFYAHPAAAESAGFRPCRRCRPEAAPGSDGWLGNVALVDRAVRLIHDGALDGGATTADLACRLHVGDRHLRRLFLDHLGTTPDAVARSRRAHLARRLLAETDLRVADVAFAAGFGSVRQCNDVVRATFDATPTELRRTGDAAAGAPLELRLAARPPFDGEALLAWFAPRAIPGVEEVVDGVYRRRVVVDDRSGWVEIEPRGEGVVLRTDLPHGTRLGSLVAGARRLFDLGADPETIDEHLAVDRRLADLVRARPGLRVPGCWSGFEAVVRAIVGQQVSVAAATTFLGRIASAYGGGLVRGADALADAPLEDVGLTAARAQTIRLVARATADGTLRLDGSLDPEALHQRLLAVRGVGPWTASYVALRLGEPDAFPAGDLHLRRAVGAGDAREAEEVAAPWRPWRAYAAMHLWHAAGGSSVTQEERR